MPRYSNYVIDQLLAPAFLLFFFLVGFAAFLIGIGLVFRSPTVSRLFGTLSHAGAAQSATGASELSPNRSHFLLKHLVPIGAMFVIGALYADYGLLTGAGNAAIVSLFNATLPPGYVFWMVESLRYFLMVSSTVSIIVGVLMIISPSSRRGTENSRDGSDTARQQTFDADAMKLAFESWVSGYPRTTGLIVTFPSMGMVCYFWDQLLRWL